MTEKKTRREFLADAATLGAGAFVLGACGHSAGAMVTSELANDFNMRPSIDNAGIQLFTVRDKMASDFEGTLAKLAEIGYREVEPVSYGGKSPQEVRAILDRYGLRAPSTHAALRSGPDLEQQLAGYQAMGHKFAAAGGPRRPPGGPPLAAPPDPRTAQPTPAPNGPPASAPPNGPPRGYTPPVPTLDSVQREIASWNEVAQAAKP